MTIRKIRAFWPKTINCRNFEILFFLYLVGYYDSFRSIFEPWRTHVRSLRGVWKNGLTQILVKTRLRCVFVTLNHTFIKKTRRIWKMPKILGIKAIAIFLNYFLCCLRLQCRGCSFFVHLLPNGWLILSGFDV